MVVARRNPGEPPVEMVVEGRFARLEWDLVLFYEDSDCSGSPVAAVNLDTLQWVRGDMRSDAVGVHHLVCVRGALDLDPLSDRFSQKRGFIEFFRSFDDTEELVLAIRSSLVEYIERHEVRGTSAAVRP